MKKRMSRDEMLIRKGRMEAVQAILGTIMILGTFYIIAFGTLLK